MGAFLAGMLDAGKELDEIPHEELECLFQMANACGTLPTAKPGGISALPTKEKLLTFMSLTFGTSSKTGVR